jgi:two-component system sensor histidine kinase MprB
VQVQYTTKRCRCRGRRATSARSQPGSGLGLAIVKQIAEIHGGTVEVAARNGHGTVARFVLPVPGMN